MILETLAGIGISIITGWLMLIHRRLWAMNKELHERVTTQQMEKHIALRLESQDTKHDALREDIKSMEAKLDKVYDAILRHMP